MAGLRTLVASNPWVFAERDNAEQLLRGEVDELSYGAINHAEWINERLSGVFGSSSFFDLAHFKTPARLRTVQRIVTQAPVQEPERDNDGDFVITIDQPIETVVDASEEHATQLYESDIGSPSSRSDTPEPLTRKGSFSFPPLPPRETLNQSFIARPSETRTTRAQSLGLDSDASDDESVDLRAPELIAHEERMRAYESPAPLAYPQTHEFNLEDAPIAPAAESEEEHYELIETTKVYSGSTYPILKSLREQQLQISTISHTESRRSTRSSMKRKAEEIEEERTDERTEEKTDEDLVTTATTTATTLNEILEETKSHEKEPVPSTAHRAVTTATKSTRANPSSRTRLGPPVRPTAIAKAKVNIKIKPSLLHKPMNTAPVAAHNQEQVRAEPQQQELKKKTSAQSITGNATTNPTFSKSTTKAPAVPTKVFSIAQKKKEADERAAAKDAAVKAQQKERRDNKIEELRRFKREDEAEKERKARENSAERRKKHLVDLDDREVKRQKSEERQEREQAVADQKKATFRDMQQQRQIRPAIKSTNSNIARPQNPPPRPPARMDLHDDMRAEEETPPRLGAPVRQPSLQRPDPELPIYPSNLSKPPVRVSNLGKKPSIFTSTSQAGPSTMSGFPQPPRNQPNMQHYATQRIPFATPAQQAQSSQVRQPQPSASAHTAARAPMQHLQVVDETSPMSLPEIHTDSSDDSDRQVSLPSWATPGHVFNTLSQQETVNPDAIFPAIRPIAMDDVFAENPARLARLRMRTSSANWVRTGDALNQVEVVEDRIGRDAIRNAGGWVYGIGQ